jgi:hypothetical protein
MEKGVNKGDGTDLFRKRTNTEGADQGWKIDDNGVTLNNGSVMADTNTQGYAGTARYKSGISIEVGTYEKNMAVTMKLAGATGTNSNPTQTKGGKAPESGSAEEDSTEATESDSTEMESTETESTETESTEAESTEMESTETESTETESTEAESTEMESTETESTETESTEAESTEMESTETESTETESTNNESTTPPTTTTCVKPPQAAEKGCPSTETPTMSCDNDGTMEFLVTGVGLISTRFKTLTCSRISTPNAVGRYCDKLDYSKTDSTKVNHPYVWQTCQKECGALSQC